MSSTKVSVRLSPDAWTRHTAEAHARRVSLATYLRQRIEEQDRIVAELAIRTAAEQDAVARAQPTVANGPPNESGTVVEVLLLLRSIAGPQKSAMVRKEVERLGLTSWS